MTNSTRSAGFFPAAFAVLLPVGVYRLWRGTREQRLLVAALATAPLAAVVTGTIDLNRYRAMFVLPFGAMVAASGAGWLWHSTRTWVRAACAVLVLTVPVEFASFYTDYMSRYRDASSVWFGHNIRGALAVVFEHDGNDPLLMSSRIPYADSYARYYSQVFRPSGPQTPVLVDGEHLSATPPSAGSWLIVGAAEAWRAQLDPNAWQTVSAVTEPSGETSFVVYRKR